MFWLLVAEVGVKDSGSSKECSKSSHVYRGMNLEDMHSFVLTLNYVK